MGYFSLRLPFPAEKMRLEKVYENPKLATFQQSPLVSQKLEQVYGGPLQFPDVPVDRPYLLGSFVQSIDGRITFPDDPSGPLVAQKNAYDPAGGLVDFWLLNVLRATCDGTMGSAGWKLEKQASENYGDVGADLEGNGMIFDEELERDRVAMGRAPLPDVLAVSLDCSEADFRHPLWNNAEGVRLTICTAPSGYARIRENCPGRFYQVTAQNPQAEGEGFAVVVTGEGACPCAVETMRILRRRGYRRLLVEAPSYANHLLVQGLMDELFLNTSGVYVGGAGLALGQGGQAASVAKHPHAELLSIHSHSPFFFYYRYLFHH